MVMGECLTYSSLLTDSKVEVAAWSDLQVGSHKWQHSHHKIDVIRNKQGNNKYAV